ncbi:hypothetical protein ACNKHU_17940 [Shigella flexneri]
MSCRKSASFITTLTHPIPAKALVDAGYDGIVSAGVGNGNLYKSLFDALATARKTALQ